MENSKKRVALYSRVSTGKQDYEVQVDRLKDFCKSKGWKITKEYKEVISGKEANRPEFLKMMDDASKREFDILLVYALDRLSREGMIKTAHYIQKFDSYGIKFHSYSEPMVSTDNEMMRDVSLAVMAAMAKQERIKISERTKVGLEKARSKGIKLGKPAVRERYREQILKLHKEGKSYRQIAKEVRYWTKSGHEKFVSVGFVHKVIKASR